MSASDHPLILAGRLALSVGECCAALGVGHDHWQEHIAPEVRIVRRGRKKLVPVSELVAWLDRNAEHVLPERPGMPPLADGPGTGDQIMRAGLPAAQCALVDEPLK